MRIRWTSSISRRHLGRAAVLLGSLLVSVQAYGATLSQAVGLFLERASPHAEVVALAADEPGPVLTDDPELAVQAGKRVEFEFVIFTILAAQGIWDEKPILDAIAERRFGLVIMENSLDDPPRPLIAAGVSERVRAALQVAYAGAGTRGDYWLYRPR